MSEYWVSKKKYYCKYCEIYIADDAPSKQHHESGMRHKGNLERYIRGIYKTGEKRKKDLEEEKREMAQVERAASAAFARDVGAGLVKGFAPVASTSSTPRKPVQNPSNPYANYTTASELGFTDPDAERLAAEQELQRSQGVIGEWEVVSVSTSVPRGLKRGMGEVYEDVKPDIGSSAGTQPAEAAVEEDPSNFRVRKKRMQNIGEIYDPGLIPIKLKKDQPIPLTESSKSGTYGTGLAISEEQPLTWAPVKIKGPAESSSLIPSVKSEPADLAPTSRPQAEASGSQNGATKTSVTIKWSKSSWGTPQEVKPDPFKYEAPLEYTETTSDALEPGPPETNMLAPPLEPVEPPGPIFKKRKAPSSTARGRRVV